MSDCLFCKIASKTIPARIVHEDEQAVAFEDINPQAPVHVLVVPRKHISSVNETSEEDGALLGHLIVTARKLARVRGIDATGYRIVLNTLEAAGQSVFHVHLHLLGGRPFVWPPG